MKFALGRIVATPGAIEAMDEAGVTPAEVIGRHVLLDRGALCAEDHEQNRQAVVLGIRIFSSFVYGDLKLWVITEADRSLTTVLLPIDY